MCPSYNKTLILSIGIYGRFMDIKLYQNIADINGFSETLRALKFFLDRGNGSKGPFFKKIENSRLDASYDSYELVGQ